MRANDVKLVSFRRGMLGEIASGGERKGPFFLKEKKDERIDFYDVWVSVYISNMTRFKISLADVLLLLLMLNKTQRTFDLGGKKVPLRHPSSISVCVL